MDPFELDACLNEAVLVEAAERAEATASLADMSFEAALPIKSTSRSQSPRQPRSRDGNQAPPETTNMLGAATHHLTRDEPHAQKRDFQEEQASQAEPWTPEGSPPPSEHDAFHAGACPVHTDPLHSNADVSSQPEPPPAAPAPHQSPGLREQPLQSTTDSRTKHRYEHCDTPVPQAKHDLHTAIHPRTDVPCIIADPLRRRSVALGSSHRSSQSPPWHRDRCRTRSPRWGSSHKVQRFGTVEK